MSGKRDTETWEEYHKRWDREHQNYRLGWFVKLDGVKMALVTDAPCIGPWTFFHEDGYYFQLHYGNINGTFWPPDHMMKDFSAEWFLMFADKMSSCC